MLRHIETESSRSMKKRPGNVVPLDASPDRAVRVAAMSATGDYGGIPLLPRATSFKELFTRLRTRQALRNVTPRVKN